MRKKAIIQTFALNNFSVSNFLVNFSWLLFQYNYCRENFHTETFKKHEKIVALRLMLPVHFLQKY
jgi:hypothetical protein